MIDVIIEWNNVLLEAIRKTGGAPCPIARASAMMHGAMYDAVNAIAKTHQPYLQSLPTPADGANKAAAAAYAGHRVLSQIYPTLQPFFNQELSNSLSQIQPNATATDIDNGRILGQAIADLMIASRANDGSTNNTPYNPGMNPGDWRPTGSGDALTPNWFQVQPFTMMSGAQFRPSRPAAYATKRDLLRSVEYAAQVNEVKFLGAANSKERTAKQTEIAFFWANDLDGTYKPPGHLFRMTQIVSQARNLPLEENARLFALVALALADAGIVAWDAKYATDLDLWRPETAIRLASTDGNLITTEDPTWEPLSINAQGKRFTPPFPAYVSGHATFGATHAGIMRNFFGTDNLTFELDTDDPSVPGVKRTFNSFSSAALENGRSRVYLGVHFQWDADAGFVSGTKLADYVFAQALRPVVMAVV
jgi:PAP2 superfamily